MNNILRTLFHNTQRGIQSVSYDVAGQLMLVLLRKDVIIKMLGAHKAKPFNTNGALAVMLKTWKM